MHCQYSIHFEGRDVNYKILVAPRGFTREVMKNGENIQGISFF